MMGTLGEVTPEKLLGLLPEELQAFGITFKKVSYIRSVAQNIASDEFDIRALRTMSDTEDCVKLSELDGISVWTSEMMILHSLQRPDVLSFGNLAVQRGLRTLYHHRKITRPIREISLSLRFLRQCRLHLSLGGVGRCDRGFERLCTEREKR